MGLNGIAQSLSMENLGSNPPTPTCCKQKKIFWHIGNPNSSSFFGERPPARGGVGVWCEPFIIFSNNSYNSTFIEFYCNTFHPKTKIKERSEVKAEHKENICRKKKEKKSGGYSTQTKCQIPSHI